ncbi:MAG TPA: hypothetical protein VFD52_04090 [Clostridia bacterium]|nr:hypothetical protein [Clostridia bacterium]
MTTALTAKNSYKFSTAYKLIAIIVGAFLMGSLWRIRGDHGFGSMWGMFTVATGFSLYVFSIFGFRKKSVYEILPLTVILTAITVGGWGTLNSQIGGFLGSSTPFLGEAASRTVEISPISGVIIMLFLGFGWMPFFGFLMGRFFSGKKYSMKDIVLTIVIFYVVQYILKATLAHLFLNIINPQAVELFGAGLVDRGIDSNQWLTYLKHFSNTGWGKTIPGGRNYFTSIEVISCAFGALGVWIYQRFILKDKIGGRVCLAICSIVALSITIADVFLVLNVKEGILGFVNAPEWITSYAWSYWEFFTGFLIGLGAMILFFVVSRDRHAENDVSDNLFNLKRKGKFAYNALLTFGFTLGITIIRPLAIRLADLQYTPLGQRIFYDLEEYKTALAQTADSSSIVFWEKSMVPEVTGYIVFGLIALIVSFLIVGINVLGKKYDTPLKTSFYDFCSAGFPLYLLLVVLFYLVLGNAYLFTPEWSPITLLMIISVLIVFSGYSIMRLIEKRSQRNN